MEPIEVLPGVLHYGMSETGSWVSDDALCVIDRADVVLVDPLPVDFGPQGVPAGKRWIVITTPGHRRAAQALGARGSTPILAPRGSGGSRRSDDWPAGYEEYGDGARLPGGLVAVAAPGPAPQHHLLHLPRGRGAVYCPDLLINHPTLGLRFVPEEYQVDPVQTRRSAWRLLELDFDVLCFGHGQPIRTGAKAAVQEFLSSGPQGSRRRREALPRAPEARQR